MSRLSGCCTWIFGGCSLSETAQRVKRSGRDGVELSGDGEALDPANARDILQVEGLQIFSTTPGDTDISHPDKAVRSTGADTLQLLPDAYHMNSEEADPAGALKLGADRIGLYHAANSNRCGADQKHTDFATQMNALQEIGYAGHIILETNVPGPTPFSPDKGGTFQDAIETHLSASISELWRLEA